MDYKKEIANALCTVNHYLDKGKGKFDVNSFLKSSMEHFLFAGEYWERKINKQFRYNDALDKKEELASIIRQKYPDIVSHETAFGGYRHDDVIKVIWLYASRDLAKAIDLEKKYEQEDNKSWWQKLWN
jgi:hypothetical protein